MVLRHKHYKIGDTLYGWWPETIDDPRTPVMKVVTGSVFWIQSMSRITVKGAMYLFTEDYKW